MAFASTWTHVMLGAVHGLAAKDPCHAAAAGSPALQLLFPGSSTSLACARHFVLCMPEPGMHLPALSHNVWGSLLIHTHLLANIAALLGNLDQLL
jgi:hypothetical protein